MTLSELKEDICNDLQSMQIVVDECKLLAVDLKDKEPTLRELTASSAYLAQFYGGVENIFKRIHTYADIALPNSQDWHLALLERFTNPPYKTLPLLFDEKQYDLIDKFRGFRHKVYHGYGYKMDWSIIKPGLSLIEPAFMNFKISVNKYLNSVSPPLPPSQGRRR